MNDLQPALKQPKIIASAILIALIVIAGIIIVSIQAFGGGNDETTAPPMTTKTATSSSSCGLPDGNQKLPEEAPKTNWALSGKMAAPRSKEFGPGTTTGDVHSCFARNPIGALFAVSNFYTDSLGIGEVGRAFVEHWYVDGPAKKKALAVATEPSSDDRKPIPQQIVAFRVDSYSPERTTVTLVTRETSGPTAGEFRSFPTTVVWANGDWKADFDTAADTAPTRIASLSGYIKWSGVS